MDWAGRNECYVRVLLLWLSRLLRGAEDASKDPDYAHTDARAVETGQAAAFIAPLISLSSPSHGNALPVGSREAAITPSLLIRCPSGLCASGSCEWSSHVLPGSPINGSMEVHSCPEEMQ
jgi:hypothetical protein